MTGTPLRIGVVGAGRMAASLAAGLLRAGFDVRAIASRDARSARGLVAALGRDIAVVEVSELSADCDLVFLAVPDAAISPACASIPWAPGQIAVHCSGALGLDVLAPATELGAIPACLHPLQSFPHRAPEPERFAGIACGVEGAEPAGTLLERITRDLGGRPFRVEGVDRRLYHAAAVFVSNHVVALATAGSQLWTLAGLPEGLAREALSPLMLSAAANIARMPLGQALTGPVARGDVATVRGHLDALAPYPALVELYRALSAQLLELEIPRPAGATEQLRTLLVT